MIGRLSERLDGVAERSLPFLVGFLVLLPFAIAAIRILSWDSGSPLGDWAALDLDVRSGPAFLGSYSQYGFRHPGPLFIWWMSWPRLIASGSAAYLVGMTALAAVAACLGVWIAWRAWGRRVGFAVAMSFVLLAPLTGWSYVTSPWNPMVGLLGLPLLVVVAAAAWDRDVVSSVAAVAVASFLIQAHVGNVGTCMAILTVLALGQLRTDARSDLRKAWGAAAGTALLLWLVPGVQQLVSGRAGNVWKIMRFSRNGPIPKTGFGDAIQAGMRAFRPRPAWLGATNVYEGVADHGRPLWLLAPLGVGMVLLWDRYAGGDIHGGRRRGPRGRRERPYRRTGGETPAWNRHRRVARRRGDAGPGAGTGSRVLHGPPREPGGSDRRFVGVVPGTPWLEALAGSRRRLGCRIPPVEPRQAVPGRRPRRSCCFCVDEDRFARTTR